MKTVMVTGATSGIGKACAEAFSAAGHRVIVTGRRQDRLDALVAALPNQALALAFDVADRQAVEAAFAGLDDAWSTIDVLVNNAGLAAGKEPMQEPAVDKWLRMIDTNVSGLLYVTAEVLPKMVARRSGQIINIGSIAGHQTYAGGTVYCATKAAVDRITQGIRLDVIGTGVRVSSVDPGVVETEFNEVRFDGDQTKAQAVYNMLARPLSAADVADAVMWVASRPEHVQIHDMLLTSTDQASISSYSNNA
jgi:NADP-dependent 3-hydroxy acid dehydrogenase YdfG